jgi:hypothetical protein
MSITKKYRVTCVITEGNPYLVEMGDKFVWSRDEFRSDTNPLENPPSDLEALNVLALSTELNWTDYTDLGIIFNIKIRKSGSNYPADIYYVNGLTGTFSENSEIAGTQHKYILTYATLGLSSGEWMWSVCSIFDQDQKNFTMWSEESLLIIK